MHKPQKPPLLPLTLYIHIPWCRSKCPYCDFNSLPCSTIPEQHYCQQLIADLEQDLPLVQNRPLSTIFIGGGTPSLLQPSLLAQLLEQITKFIPLTANLEITLEANPGTLNRGKLAELKAAGINRLSLGVQSLQNSKLRLLGRIHDRATAIASVEAAHDAGFSNINLDLMYSLPQQNRNEALQDLAEAIKLCPNHLSWYQLTIEPNTPFAKRKLALPSETDTIYIEEHGRELLTKAGFLHYELSAYSRPGQECQHNLNYWQFGDYLGIGAGAHAKITNLNSMEITRFTKHSDPNHYLASTNFIATKQQIPSAQLACEFMLNTLRLYQPIPLTLFQTRTGLKPSTITEPLASAQEQGLLTITNEHLTTTPKGKRFLNELLELFLLS